MLLSIFAYLCTRIEILAIEKTALDISLHLVYTLSEFRKNDHFFSFFETDFDVFFQFDCGAMSKIPAKQFIILNQK